MSGCALDCGLQMFAGVGDTEGSAGRGGCSLLLQGSCSLLLKDYSLVAVKQHAVLNVPAHATGKNDFFEVAAFLQQIVDRIAMRNANHVLFDDGTVVEYFGDVVTGGADQLDAALKGLMVGLGADKCRQE